MAGISNFVEDMTSIREVLEVMENILIESKKEQHLFYQNDITDKISSM